MTDARTDYQKFIELTERYLQRDITDADAKALNRMLASDAELRRLFVDLCTDAQYLGRAFSQRNHEQDLGQRLAALADTKSAPKPDEAKKTTGDRSQETAPLSAAGVPMYRKGYEPQPFKLRPHHFALAAATLLIAGLAVGLYSAVAYYQHQVELEKEQAAIAAARDAQPVATLIQRTGNLTTPSGYPSDGRDYPRGEYALSSGSAEFMLTNTVNVKLRGETRMTMRDDMNVVLTRGSAEFVVPNDAKNFTVHLPDKSKIVDLGTAFTVKVDENGRSHVRVLDGSVRVTHHASGATEVINIGQRIALDSTTLGPPQIDPLAGHAPLAHYSFDGADPIDLFTAPESAAFLRDRSLSLIDPSGTHGRRIELDGDAPQRQDVPLSLDLGADGPLNEAGLVDADGRIGVDGETLYLSWLTRGSGRAPKGWAGINFYHGTKTTAFVGKNYLRATFSALSGESDEIDLDRYPATPELEAIDIDDATHRFVVRIEYREGGDRVSIWLDPDPQAEQPPKPNGVFANTEAHFDRLTLTAGGGAGISAFDELLMGTTWRSVVPMPLADQPPPTYSIFNPQYSRTQCRAGIPHLPRFTKTRRSNTMKSSMMNRTYRMTGIATVFAATVFSTAALGAVLDYDESIVAAPRAASVFVIGSRFTVTAGTDQTISHLGAQDTNISFDGYATVFDGFFTAGTVPVGIWLASDTSTPLATVTVDDTDILIDSWRYKAIAGGPITLTAGETYLIGAVVGAAIEVFLDADLSAPSADPFSATSPFSLDEAVFAASGVLVAPTGSGGPTPGRWGAANATFIPAIPTPAALPAGLAMLMLGTFRRRR